jgi:hypothetical protein
MAALGTFQVLSVLAFQAYVSKMLEMVFEAQIVNAYASGLSVGAR